MRLYRTATGAWAGTQAEAGKGFTQVDVPDSKAERIEWLNIHARGSAPQARLGGPDHNPLGIGQPPKRDMDATATLSRMESGAGVDALVETISKARGYTLKRFAGAVALAFGAL